MNKRYGGNLTNLININRKRKKEGYENWREPTWEKGKTLHH